jgi:hypothetical protein
MNLILITIQIVYYTHTKYNSGHVNKKKKKNTIVGAKHKIKT